MATGSGERIIVNSTIDLAHHLGLRAVAEGRGRPLPAAPTHQLGCDVVQGYAISRPLAGADFVRWLADFNAAELIGPRAEREPQVAARAEAAAPEPSPLAGERLAAMLPIPAVGHAA